METKYTLTATSGALIGVGFTKMDANPELAAYLIGAGVLLQIIVAVLQKVGVPVQSAPEAKG